MDTQVCYTFSKSERLVNVKLIENLFKTNESVKAFPILFIYSFFEPNFSIQNQIMFSVSKKKFKRAVDRNHIKRLMRESYRLQKHLFNALLPEKKYYGAFIFNGKELPNFELVNKSLEKIYAKLNETDR